MNNLSVKECLRFGWRTFRTRTGFFVSAAAVLIGAQLVYMGLDHFANSEESLFAFMFGITAIALSFLMGMSQVAFSLRAHDAPATVMLKDLWAPHPFWKFVGVTLLTCIAVLIGFILLIVPGVILMLAFMFGTYIVMDTQAGPIEAMKRSMAITKGNWLKLLLLLLAGIGINILGLIVIGVGLLVSIPVTLLAFAHAYRVLSAQYVPVVAPVMVTAPDNAATSAEPAEVTTA